LLQGKIREQHLKAQLDALQGDVSQYKQRLTECEQASEAQRERLEARIHALEKDNTRLVEELGINRTEAVRRQEQSKEDEHNRLGLPVRRLAVCFIVLRLV
jgi:predicted  nucleic acid-binding Zn-ribbon protein